MHAYELVLSTLSQMKLLKTPSQPIDHRCYGVAGFAPPGAVSCQLPGRTSCSQGAAHTGMPALERRVRCAPLARTTCRQTPPSRRHAACRAGASDGSGSGGGSGGMQMAREAPQKQPGVTGPLRITTLEQLTSVERQPAPLWSTFFGTSGGCWQGTSSAFNPNTGKADARTWYRA